MFEMSTDLMKSALTRPHPYERIAAWIGAALVLLKGCEAKEASVRRLVFRPLFAPPHGVIDVSLGGTVTADDRHILLGDAP